MKTCLPSQGRMILVTRENSSGLPHLCSLQLVHVPRLQVLLALFHPTSSFSILGHSLTESRSKVWPPVLLGTAQLMSHQPEAMSLARRGSVSSQRSPKLLSSSPGHLSILTSGQHQNQTKTQLRPAFCHLFSLFFFFRRSLDSGLALNSLCDQG